MFNRLRQKWNVSSLSLLFIFITFATGGSLCGYLGRHLIGLISIESPVLRFIIYIVLVTLLWPFCVLLVSIPLGQFRFFVKYLGRMGRRLRGKSYSF